MTNDNKEYQITKEKTGAVIDVIWQRIVKYFIPWLLTFLVITIAVLVIPEMFTEMGLSLLDDPVYGELNPIDILFTIIMMVVLSWGAGFMVGELAGKIDVEKKDKNNENT